MKVNISISEECIFISKIYFLYILYTVQYIESITLNNTFILLHTFHLMHFTIMQINISHTAK